MPDSMAEPPQSAYDGLSRVHPPLLLFSVHGVSGYTCTLVPFDSDERLSCPATGLAAPPTAWSDARPLPPGMDDRQRPADGDDAETEAALRVLSWTALDGLHRLIDPAVLHGGVFKHTGRGAIQLHFTSPDKLVATLGPTRYQRLIKVLTGPYSFHAGPSGHPGISPMRVSQLIDLRSIQTEWAKHRSVRHGILPVSARGN